jgi:hypothetical protein
MWWKKKTLTWNLLPLGFHRYFSGCSKDSGGGCKVAHMETDPYNNLSRLTLATLALNSN